MKMKKLYMRIFLSEMLLALRSCGLIIIALFSVSCATNFERPVNDIVIIFDSLEYLETEEDAMLFAVNGRLKNPNEFSIRPLRFTYQISLDGRHFDKGLIRIQGRDETIGFVLNTEKLSEAKIDVDVNKVNAKLLYKSNSSFRFTFQVPFDRIGGFVAALEADILPYSINLILTDERGKRAVHSEEGNIRLSAILQPVEFKNLAVVSKDGASTISFGLHNANDFALTVESCGYQLVTGHGTDSNKIPSDKIHLAARGWEFVRLEAKSLLPTGAPYVFQGGCLIKESWFSNSLSGTVQ